MMSFPRLGLLARIALALAAMGLIPLLLASYRLAGINEDSYQDQVLQTHSVAARTAAQRVDALLLSLRSVIETVANNPVIAADPNSRASQEILTGLLQARPDIHALVLTDPQGAEAGGVRRTGMQAEVERARQNGDGSSPRLSVGEGRQWLILERELAQAVGRVMLMADALPLSDMLQADELGDQAELILASTRGEVLAGTADLTQFPSRLVELARTRQLSGASVDSTAAGEEVLGAFAAVSDSDWFVISRQPARLAEAIRLRMRRDQRLTLGLALLLLGLLSTLAYFTLVRPIQQVVDAQRRLAGLSSEPRSGDEISELRTSFEKIEQRLQDQQEIGKVFLGRYQVIEVLGEGAMGTVFRGWDPKLQRQVALKTVRLNQDHVPSKRRDLAAQLFREATTAARITDPHIVAIFDAEHSGDVAFIAMEFIEGVGLDALLWRRGPLRTDQAIELALAMAEALTASHSHGVVHRDVKPSNVLLGFDGSIKMADFGIAEFVSAMTDESETFFGTPGYVPPETLRGEGYDELGDLFALGVVLYECCTGRQPFAGKDLRETAMRTLKLHPEPVNRIKPEVPVEISELIDRLLDKDKSRRPTGARKVVEYLEKLSREWRSRWDPSSLPQRSERGAPETVPRSQLLPTFVISSTTKSMEEL